MSFQDWIQAHDPNHTFNWENPESVKQDLIRIIKSSGNLNLEYVFCLFFETDEPFDFKSIRRCNRASNIWLEYSQK